MMFPNRPTPVSLREGIERSKDRRLTALLARIVGHLDSRHALWQLSQLTKRGALRVGSHTYGLPSIYTSHPDDRVTIGKFCSIAPGVTLIPGGIHPTDSPSTFPFRKRWGYESIDSAVTRKGPIDIQHDVWIGTGATILSGVTIETGAVIAAGAVVTRDVAAYSIAAGVPARIIGQRFPQSDAVALLASRWWELSDDRIVGCMDLLTARDVRGFLEFINEG